MRLADCLAEGHANARSCSIVRDVRRDARQFSCAPFGNCDQMQLAQHGRTPISRRGENAARNTQSTIKKRPACGEDSWEPFRIAGFEIVCRFRKIDQRRGHAIHLPSCHSMRGGVVGLRSAGKGRSSTVSALCEALEYEIDFHEIACVERMAFEVRVNRVSIHDDVVVIEIERGCVAIDVCRDDPRPDAE